jgi:hypothetical protein
MILRSRVQAQFVVFGLYVLFTRYSFLLYEALTGEMSLQGGYGRREGLNSINPTDILNKSSVYTLNVLPANILLE